MYVPFIKQFKSGDPVREVSNHVDHNRVANILNDVDGVGCHWEKPTNGEGRGWMVVVDGEMSDRYVATDTGNTPGYLAARFNDTAAIGGDDVTVYRGALVGSAPNQKIQFFVKNADLNDTVHTTAWGDLSGTPVKVLGKDTAGTVGWVTITTTAVDLAAQTVVAHDTAGAYLYAKALKVKLAPSAGAIALASDTYGVAGGAGACDT